MTFMKRFELWLSRTAFGVWMSKAFASRVDPVIFGLSGGRFTSMGPIVIPQLVLTTRGRKSGQERDAQLAYTDLDGAACRDRLGRCRWRMVLEPPQRLEVGEA